MQGMAHTLRHRLGHPVETTLELLGAKWRPDFLADLKQRLLHHAEIRNVISRSSSGGHPEAPSSSGSKASENELHSPSESSGPCGSELQTPKTGRALGARLSPEAEHVMQLYFVGQGIAVE